jgi:hypothetical protein
LPLRQTLNGNPREQLHVHVRAEGCEAKFWLTPMVSIANNDGFDARTLRELTRVIEENTALIERTWHDYFR